MRLLKFSNQKQRFTVIFVQENILFENSITPLISDMGSCGEFGNINGTKIYGIMLYVVPEVKKMKPYTQDLALNICNGLDLQIQNVTLT